MPGTAAAAGPAAAAVTVPAGRGATGLLVLPERLLAPAATAE